MIPRDFDAITKTDVEALMANAVAEGRALEYKQQLPGNGDEDKKEFLADVSSFANAGGGDIVFGVVEKRDGDNKPTNLPDKAEGPVAGINAGAEINRLDAIIQSIRASNHASQAAGFGALMALHPAQCSLFAFPKSWAGPHMVTFKNLSRFFSRTSAGKQQLDVGEIRSAFTASGDLRAKITAFRTERLGKIIANEGPVVLPDTPKVILHLIPLTILDPATRIDLAQLNQNPAQAPPIRATGWNHRFNSDGFLTYSQYRLDQPADSYLQVFRSGIFEAVATNLMMQREGKSLIPATALEGKLLDSLRKYLAIAKGLGVSMPDCHNALHARC